MTSTTFRVHDAMPMPHDAAPLTATARRVDTYDIHVVTTLDALSTALAGLVGDASVAVITDEDVDAIHGGTVLRALRAAGADPLVHVLPAGEPTKSLNSAIMLWDWLADHDVARRDVIVNLGGGVIADLGGWVAGTYMRGLPYVNVPTTLLAQVDGALGGKVAVNHPLAKNLIGGFHQPTGVVSHVGFLASTSRRHMAAGLAEAIKKAMIASPSLWDFIEARVEAILRREPEPLARLVRAASAIKTTLIARDPYEQDLRRPLNFGHTIGHPVETVTGYGVVLHGEAVAFGMVVESRIAAERGLLAARDLEALIDLLRRCDLPTCAEELRADLDGERLVAALEKVRQIRAGSLRYVLPVALGETVIADDVGELEARRALAACGVRLRSAVIG